MKKKIIEYIFVAIGAVIISMVLNSLIGDRIWHVQVSCKQTHTIDDIYKQLQDLELVDQ